MLIASRSKNFVAIAFQSLFFRYCRIIRTWWLNLTTTNKILGWQFRLCKSVVIVTCMKHIFCSAWMSWLITLIQIFTSVNYHRLNIVVSFIFIYKRWLLSLNALIILVWLSCNLFCKFPTWYTFPHRLCVNIVNWLLFKLPFQMIWLSCANQGFRERVFVYVMLIIMIRPWKTAFSFGW